MPLDLRSTPARMVLALVAVAVFIAVFWELLPPYGIGPPFPLPPTIVLLASLVALLVLVGGGVAIAAALTGWVVDLDRTAARRWQGVTPMSLGFYLARHGAGALAPNLDGPQREAALAAMQSILDLGQSTIFVLTDHEGFVDRIIVATRASAATMRQWAGMMSADHAMRASRVDRAELARRYPGMSGPAWWISWE